MNKKYIIIVIVGLLLSQVVVKHWVSSQKEYQEMLSSNPFTTLPSADYLGTYIASLLLSGFKPLLVDYLWIKQDKLQQEKQFEEIRLLLSIIARLQPRFVEVWSFNAYNMVYNISHQQKLPEMRWDWVKAGLDYIREGMKHNPGSAHLAHWTGLFYYDRIAQEPYLMQQVETEQGQTTYEIASSWYQTTIDLYRAKGMDLYGRMYLPMYFGCRFLHAFELVKKNKFDEAIQELENLLNYKKDDALEQERLKDLIEVFRYNKEISRITPDSPQYFTKNSLLLDKYREISFKHIGYDFRPINERVEFILNKYLNYTYYLIDQKEYDKAAKQMEILLNKTNNFIPELDTHPIKVYYQHLLERYSELQTLIHMECYLRSQGMVDIKRATVGGELKSLYEQYIRKNQKYYFKWLLLEERERFNKLFR